MGSFNDYLNKKNINNNNGSSFMNYYNTLEEDRKRKREEQERQEAQRREQEEQRRNIEAQEKVKNEELSKTNEQELSEKIKRAWGETEEQQEQKAVQQSEQAKNELTDREKELIEIASSKNTKEFDKQKALAELESLGQQRKMQELVDSGKEIQKPEEVQLPFQHNKSSNGSTFKKSKHFEDGYQIGDVTLTAIDTLGDAIDNTAKGFVNVAEAGAEGVSGIIADVSDLYAGINEKIGNKDIAEVQRNFANNMRNEIKKGTGRFVTNAMDKNKDPMQEEGSVLDKKGREMAQGVGQTVGYIGLNALPGGSAISTTGMGLSAAGNEFHEGLNDPEMTLGQVRAKAYSSMIIEPVVEHLFGFFGETGVDEKAANYIANKVAKSELGEFLIRRGMSALGEGAEEVISYSLNTLVDQVIDDVNKATGGKGKALSHPWEFEEAWNQATSAMGSALLVNGGVDISNISTNYDSNKSLEQNVGDYIQKQNAQARELNQSALPVNNEANRYSNKLNQTQENNVAERFNQELPRANNQVQENKLPTVNHDNKVQENNNKQKQLDIIKENNPMTDDYHTGIRNIEDIKTFEEAMQDDESFVYGDFTKEDAEKALQEGKVTVYSSKPIKQGSFVSTSQNMAKDYAGNEKIYSQEVDLKDVAWINGDEGQYAKVENNQETLYNNNESEVINYEYGEEQRRDNRELQEFFRNSRRSTNKQGNDTEILGNEKSRKAEQKQKIIEYANKYPSQKLTQEETDLIKNIEKNTGIKTIAYDLGGETPFGGLTQNGTLYIDKALNEANSRDVILHELIHGLRQTNNPIYKNDIYPIIEEIADNKDYASSLVKYITEKSQEFTIEDLEMPEIRQIIAEDIIGNTSASLHGNLIADYDLSDEMLVKIKDTVGKIINSNDSENSNESSFNLQEIQPIESPTGDKSISTATTIEEQKQITKILDEPITKEKEKSRWWAIAKANLIDKGIVFEELSHKAKNRELQGKWDYMLLSGARGQDAIGKPRYERDSKTKTEKQICKSLEDIKTEVGKNRSEFQNYMYHQLNIDRMTLKDRFGIDNKPVFGDNISAYYSKELVAEYEKNHPEFKEYAQNIYDFLDANKKELVDKGVISQELSDKLKELYPHYVPIKRVDKKGSAVKVPLDTYRTGVNSPLAKATGGSSDIEPLFQTIANRTEQTYKASARNNFGVELMNTLNSVTESSKVDVDSILEQIGDEDTELLKEGKNGENPTFTVFNNGEKVTFEITKDMYDALKPQSDIIKNINNSWISKGINKVSNFRRGILTEYNPVFSLTNAIKDVQDVVINSQHAAKTYAKFPEAYAQIMKKGYWYNEYVANGGEQNSYFKDGEFESDKKQSKLKTAVTMPLNAISKVNNVIEMAPRLAEYIASREAGRSVETSMLDAARVTTNFKAGGDITKTLNRNGFTFLNASVQGFQQQVRNIQEANTKGLKGYAVLATKYAIAGLPAILLNNLIWKDDEDYQNLQDYAKDNYYIVAKLGNGKFLRIPKGRVAATVQKIVSNATEYITDDKQINIDNLAKDFYEDAKFARDNVAPNNPIENNILTPIFNVAQNKTWYGSDLVPKRLQDKPAKEQYDETTDSLSIWLGDKLNVSPYKINYLLDQYGGGVSDIALPRFTKQAENNMLEDKFTTDAIMKNKYPGEFYDNLDKLKTKANSSKATDEDILKYKYASSKSSDLNELYQQKRDIQNSNMTDKEKKKELKTIQEKINKLSKESLENIDILKISGNTATIKDNQYYKAKNVSDETMQWNKLTDKEKEKNKDISLKTYADYKNKLADETIKQRKNGVITNEEQLKNKDKINVVLNSSYSNKEKSAIYENYIGKEDDVYQILKNTDININQYLKYKQQDFAADKIDDGTLSGKSVSGSKKEKIRSYIDDMQITYMQKLMLFGSQYTLSDREQTQIVNYIESLNKTRQEKLDMLSNFKGFTIYKDGRFTY